MTEHEATYEAIAQQIGINALRAILENATVEVSTGKFTRKTIKAFPTPERMAELSKEDEWLNNVSLSKWDKQDFDVRRLAGNAGIKSWSLSQTVSLLKHVAKYHYTRLLADDPKPEPEPSSESEQEETPENISLDQFISKHGIKFECHRVDSRPDGLMESDDPMRHFRCRIHAHHYGKERHNSFGLYFSQGSAHTDDPTLADVLDCLAGDAAGYENARAHLGTKKADQRPDFENWCEEYGYDIDSRKAEKTFRAIKRQAEQLRRTIGEEAYQELLYNTERL